MRTTRSYERFLDWGKRSLERTPVVGGAMFEALHGVKKGLKDIVAPQGMFEDLGLKYVGPVDGHDEETLEKALRQAKEFGGPVIVHVITQKGRGYQPAIDDAADQFHSVGKINPETGLPFEVSGRIWTDEFNEEMVAIGRARPDVVAITAAMMIPVGLDGFAAAHPDRVFDVGIAEQHAVTMASGLAFAGLHPVVAVYATFLNRAFDQLLMDCALHHAGVTFILDRAGLTGSDGASHNGMWDMTLTAIVPGLRLAAPRDGDQVRAALREAIDVTDGPTVIRFPKGDVADPLLAVRRQGEVDVLFENGGADVDLLVIGVGAFAGLATEAGEKIAAMGRTVRVIDPRWVLPVSDEVVSLAAAAGAVAVIEDNLVSGGVGAAVSLALYAAGVAVPVHPYGIPKQFLEHASRVQLLEQLGLTAEHIVTDLEPRL